MSRFFRGGSDSEDSDASTSSASSDEYSSASSAEQVEVTKGSVTKQSAVSRFLRSQDNDEGSDSDEESQRVVRSAKDKFEDENKAIGLALKEAQDDVDMQELSSEFDRLQKLIAKHQNTLIRDHGYPQTYVAAILQLQQFTQKDQKVSGSDLKIQTALKAKVKRTLKSLQEAIGDLDAYTSMPQQATSKALNGGSFFRETNESESEEEETETEEESSEEEESSSDEEDEKAVGVNRWKKSTAVATPQAAVKKPLAKQVIKPKTVEGAQDDDFVTVEKKSSKNLEINASTLNKRLSEVLESRGKKGTDKSEQIVILEKLLVVAVSPVQKIKVLLALVSARYDFNQGIASYQSLDMWKKTEVEANNLLEILEQQPHLTLTETGEDWDETVDSGQEMSIRGSLVSIVSRLDDELSKHLQNIDSPSDAYTERYNDQPTVYKLIVRAENYCILHKETDNVALLRILRLENLYYQYNSEAAKRLELKLNESEVDQLVQYLCTSLYKTAQDRSKMRVLLYHAYHHSLHMRFQQARDLLLMSRLQESIHNADVSTQVLYNRALTQYGVCAFRCGHIKDAHNALNDIMGLLKAKDVLSQGTQQAKYVTETDKREKQRILPYHLHMNMELLESIQLTTAMLLEIPIIAGNAFDARKKSQSKHFRKMFEHYQAQVYQGPPENYRECIMSASCALSDGNWRHCRDLIVGVKSWDLLPFNQQLKSTLEQLIKEEALRTYLLSASQLYKTINLAVLKEQFDLEMSKINQIVCRMIYNQELQGSLDRESQMVTIQREYNLTKLQFMAVQYAEKIGSIIESSEKLAELKFESNVKSNEDSKFAARGR